MAGIVLYFGSFNPVHNGHLAIADYLLRNGFGEELWFIVSPSNPLKRAAELAGFDHRFRMTELAAAASPFRSRIRVSDIERHLPVPSFTVNTLDKLREEHPEHRFSLLMGSDNLVDIGKWKDHERILNSTPVLIYPRVPYETAASHPNITLLEDAPRFPVSSTELRRRLEAGEDVASLLPAPVLDYIQKHRLYG